MILYHITQCLTTGPNFIPRVPKNRVVGEDDTSARICVSDSIEGCLSSIPNGGANLDDTIGRTNGVYKLFRVNTDKLGIKENDIVKPEELYEKQLVHDATLTGEHWITKAFEVPNEDIQFIHISQQFGGSCSIPSPEAYQNALELGMDVFKYIGTYKRYDLDWSFWIIEEVTAVEAKNPLSPVIIHSYEEREKVHELVRVLGLKAEITECPKNEIITVDFEKGQNITSFLLYLAILPKIQAEDIAIIESEIAA